MSEAQNWLVRIWKLPPSYKRFAAKMLLITGLLLLLVRFFMIDGASRTLDLFLGIALGAFIMCALFFTHDDDD